MRPAVVRVRTSFDELTVFEIVDELDHLVAVQAHCVSQLLLRGAFGVGEAAQELEVAGTQPAMITVPQSLLGGESPEEELWVAGHPDAGRLGVPPQLPITWCFDSPAR